ncbi:hypothetical protein GPECTOR_35g918 [Gonium pectorale]|uniref:N-acetyltransferase domain-containing protein n=1 Tax=Gonium pectorale TaxID=33097 RepID=A0A150GDR0_GONPE|nr:hypothetical protein GPECTOR_35g918 [Gonium pectorale]|eukprot:KXZ47480.1 hypothetical protein GPECTOR_35g918 [Gonium pectorale]
MSTAQGERRLRLAASRSLLYSLPANELFELPGRPHVVYQLRSYANTGNAEEAAQQARNDAPFLFKAFETGQIGPKRLARIHGDKPRVATIHEYLDWTVTAQAAEGDDELDFGGFRVLLILPRYRSGWPPPGGEAPPPEAPRVHALGAPKSPMPVLQTHGRPVTAATIRSGPGYLEIPFVATHENKRGRGYCRCLVEAVEDIARALGLNKLMLCSTNDSAVKSTWQHLGFQFASDEQMEEWDILHTDLVYLQNTTQMHKDVPPRRRLKPVIIRHEVFKSRTYSFVGHKRPPQRGAGGGHAASKRLNSRRSISSTKEDSQLLSVREQAAAASALGKGDVACSGTPFFANSPPATAAGSGLGVTPHSGAALPAAARMFAEEGLQPHGLQQPEQHGRLGMGMGAQPLRDDGIGAGGPPTPPPADGGALRPLYAHGSSGAASVSAQQRLQTATTAMDLPDDLSAAAGLAPLGGPGQGEGGWGQQARAV